MGKLNALLTGSILGAGYMYFCDPRLGRQRRKLFGDQMVRLSLKTTEGVDAAMRDLTNRTRGTIAELEACLMPRAVSDDVLCQRVRSVAGRYMSNASALEVDVHEGCVCLGGPILASEAPGLVAAVRGIHGVRGVEDHLDKHDSRGNVSALQGHGCRTGQSRFDAMQSNWAPGTRLVAAAAGSLLMANCLARRTPGAILMGTLGFGLFTRAMANLGTRRAVGVSGGRRAIDIQKSIEIAASADKVFEFFSTPENYTKISDTIIEARSLGGGRFMKQMLIAGVPVHFEERFTRTQQGELLESRSEPGSALQYMKTMRLEKAGDNCTRLHVLFSYNPPGGVIGHSVATVLGFDPKTLLDDLLVRAKHYLETGRQPHDAIGRYKHDGSAPKSAASFQGTGAPTDDTLMAELHRGGSRPPWPPSPAEEPAHAGISEGRFPPSM